METRNSGMEHDQVRNDPLRPLSSLGMQCGGFFLKKKKSERLKKSSLSRQCKAIGI